MSRTSSAESASRGVVALRLLLLWLAGADLRLTLLAVPPVLPLIHRDLALDETSIGALTGLPVLLLGLGAIPGSLLVARLGARRALIAGLTAIALSSALRGVGPTSAVLFGMSFAMGAAIAIIQPTLPSMVKSWFPGSVALASAVYANGLLVGELATAGLTLPVILPVVGGSWPLALFVWAFPVAITALLIALFTPHERKRPDEKAVLWWPNWRDTQVWKLGLMQGANGAVFFGANSFIPDYLHAIGRGELVAACLAALNGGPLVASAAALLWASRLTRSAGPTIAGGFLILLGLVGVLSGIPVAMVAGAAILGFGSAIALILLIALPPLLVARDEVHRLSAGMFMIGFTLSFVLPLLGGAAWDWSGYPAAAFLPVAIGGLLIPLTAARTQYERAATPR
ncbi:MAG TPA: MFS transporter [Stellaceae bacterium]|nr:MFS transporter [Stellaceae bacterium]